MTDAVNHADVAVQDQTRARVPVAVSVEAVAYILILVLALAVRLAEIDTIPLSHSEAHEALAAWHFVSPDAAGSAPLSASPLLFALNSIAFTLFGASELGARLMTVLGGTALVMSPVLWRREMGRGPALLTSLLLVLSPAALTASRTMSPAVWSLLAAVIGLWAAKQFYSTRSAAYGVGAVASAFTLVLLADPAGFVLAIVLAVAWWVAVLLSADDAPEQQPGPKLRTLLADWPWRDSLLTGAGLVLVAGTLVFMYPRGLAQVGEMVSRGVSGLWVRPDGYPLAFPVLAFLLYEPPLWLFGGIGLRRALGDGSVLDRFLVGWVIGGVLALMLYVGAGPDYALWLALPLAALAARVIAGMFEPVTSTYWNVAAWSVAALASGVFALLWVSSVNTVFVARALARMNELNLMQLQPLRLMLAAMALVLLVILFFLGGSMWGSKAAWRGLGLGVALFLCVNSGANAWRIAVTFVDNPQELWHVQPVNRHLGLLRETVIEASLRDNGTPNRLALVTDQPDNGALAWQLRGFADTRFEGSIDRRTDEAVVIAREGFQPETLGARYVGQDFILSRTWDFNALRLFDVPVWFMYREAPAGPQVAERVILWLRDDIYGLPPELVGEEIVP